MLIFKGNDVAVKFIHRPSAALCVTFSDHFQPQGSFRKGFGEDALKDVGLASIHVLSSSNHWWQSPEMEQALLAIKGVIAGFKPSRIMTYGASMGGYGAIHFADELGATRSLTFCPQFDIWTSEETRWRAEAENWPRIRPQMNVVLSDSCEHISFVDMREKLDAAQATLFRCLRIIDLPNCGHRVVPLLHEIGFLKILLTQFMYGADASEIEASMKGYLHKNRRKSSTYLASVLTRLMFRKRPFLSKLILEKMRDGVFLSVDQIHERDFVAFMRVAAEANAEWLVDALLSRVIQVDGLLPKLKAPLVHTLKRNRFLTHVERLERSEEIRP